LELQRRNQQQLDVLRENQERRNDGDRAAHVFAYLKRINIDKCADSYGQSWREVMVMGELRRVSNFNSSGGFHLMIQILETESTGRYLSTSAPALSFKDNRCEYVSRET